MLKTIDFGLSKKEDMDNLGSPYYIEPEIQAKGDIINPATFGALESSCRSLCAGNDKFARGLVIYS